MKNFASLEEVLDNAVSSVIFEEYLETLGQKRLFTFLEEIDMYMYELNYHFMTRQVRGRSRRTFQSSKFYIQALF